MTVESAIKPKERKEQSSGAETEQRTEDKTPGKGHRGLQAFWKLSQPGQKKPEILLEKGGGRGSSRFRVTVPL